MLKNLILFVLIIGFTFSFNKAKSQLPLSAPKCEKFQATSVSEITDDNGIGWKYANDTSKAYLNKSLFTGYTNKVCSNNGFLFSIEMFENGELIIEANYHYSFNNIPSIREIKRYQNRVLHGKTQTYYKNGKMCSEENYSNGKLNGDWLLYDEEGALITKKVYMDGIETYCKGKYCE